MPQVPVTANRCVLLIGHWSGVELTICRGEWPERSGHSRSRRAGAASCVVMMAIVAAANNCPRRPRSCAAGIRARAASRLPPAVPHQRHLRRAQGHRHAGDLAKRHGGAAGVLISEVV